MILSRDVKPASHHEWWAGLFAAIAIGLVAINLRPFLAGPGSVLPDIIADTGISVTHTAGITVLPFVVMGLGAMFAPELQSRLGTRWAVFLGLSGIFCGSIMRGVPLNGLFFLLSAIICGSGAAVLQAIMPAFIRVRFDARFAPVMGFYSALLLGGGALGAQLVPAISNQFGSWRIGLAMLGIPALVAMIVALAVFKPVGLAAKTKRGPKSRFHWPTYVWILMLVFGLLNMSYGSLVAWLGSHYMALGQTSLQAGGLVGIMSITQACTAVVLPFFIGRQNKGWGQLFFGIGCQVLGFALLLYPLVPPFVTAGILGIGLGGTFSVMYVIVLKHARTNDEAIGLSGFVQGGGFLITAAAPLIAAGLIQSGGGFSTLWWFHIGTNLMSALLVCVLLQRNWPERSPV